MRATVMCAVLLFASLTAMSQVSPNTVSGPAVNGGNQTAPSAPGAVVPSQSNSSKFQSAPTYVFWMIFAAISVLIVGGLIAIAKLLRHDKDWTFADAMSGPDGKPSASRIIAFLGFLVMIAVILGIGYSSLWVFLATGQLPLLSGATTFIVACAGLFAPYLANQIGWAIGGQTSAPQALAPVVVQTSNSALQFGQSVTPSVTFGAPVKPPIT